MKLSRPLVILDLETTGIWIDKDRVIEIGMIKCFPDGKKDQYLKRVNPQIRIPAAVTEITGITDEDVHQAPVFALIARQALDFIGDADLGGFNVERFDLPLLAREFSDAGLKFEWSSRNIYDAQKIYHLHEKRDLSAAYQFYCHKELKDAHSALADSEAALAILQEQLRKYAPGKEQVEALQDFDYKQRSEYFDADRRFRWWNGELYMLFGKYAKKESMQTIVKKDPQYLEWVLSKDFSDEVKVMVQSALKGQFPAPPS